MSRNELIAKLEEISSLYDKQQKIINEMNDFTPEDNYERKVVVPTFPGNYKSEAERALWQNTINHKSNDAVDQMLVMFDKNHRPKEPEKATVPECPSSVDVEQQKVKKTPLLKIAIGLFIFFLLMNVMIGHTIAYKIFSWLGMIASIALAVRYFMKLNQAKTKDEASLAEMQKQHQDQVTQAEEQYQNAMKVYEEQCASYKATRQGILDDYTAWRKAYLAHLKEEEEIAEKVEADRVAVVNKINEERLTPATKALREANDLISENHLPVIDVIIDLIRSNRADDVKEAVNIYEEMVYRERQLELQREKELQRQREEQRRRKDEERRYQEQMQFQKQQEYNRQREVEQQRKDEERRHQEEMRQRDQQERDRKAEENRRAEEERQNQLKQQRIQREQAEKQRSAAQAQCRACANVGHCNMSIHNNTPNCTGFRPR